MRERKKPRISWVTKTKWILRMEKLKNAIKWIGTDGLLHFLVCYALILALTPLIGFYALIPTTIAALGKEGYDYHVKKSNSREQVIHDLVCDLAGIVAAYATMLIWMVFYL
jgi:hypothetical protein